MSVEHFTTSLSKLMFQSYRPKSVEMHMRVNLDSFKEQAEATGIGLQWPQWRYSIEVGGKQWQNLVAKGLISLQRTKEIKTEVMGPQIKTETKVPPPPTLVNLSEMSATEAEATLKILASRLGITVPIPERKEIVSVESSEEHSSSTPTPTPDTPTHTSQGSSSASVSGSGSSAASVSGATTTQTTHTTSTTLTQTQTQTTQ
jgi:hypothetical protein